MIYTHVLRDMSSASKVHWMHCIIRRTLVIGLPLLLF